MPAFLLCPGPDGILFYLLLTVIVGLLPITVGVGFTVALVKLVCEAKRK